MAKDPRPTLDDIAEHLDALLDTRGTPDYPGAMNGVQLDHTGPVRAVAGAVDFSRRVIEGAIEAGANLLLLHHGMFWSGMQPLVGVTSARLRRLIENDIAVYASHLPLDRHPDLGNNALLVRELELEATGRFVRHESIEIGLWGDTDIETSALAARARAFSERHEGQTVVTPYAARRRTRRWGMCTGAGASSATLAEAASLGIDTLIVGEGPHHAAVQGEELGIVIIYAGHYATETLGVHALAQHVGETFGIPWSFVAAPTGT